MKQFTILFFAVFLFTACSSNVLKDRRDGKVYKTVKVGNQVWMAENLAFLPKVNKATQGALKEPHYYVYGYNGTDVKTAKTKDNYKIYGVLYNWSAAMTACPRGWHLPSDAEWKELEMFVGMTYAEANSVMVRGTDEGAKLKEEGTVHWHTNRGATNSIGFKALPGGYRNPNGGQFDQIRYYGYWWSSTQDETYFAWIRELSGGSYVSRSVGYKEDAHSVRCVKDKRI